jgi:hypothetical protein
VEKVGARTFISSCLLLEYNEDVSLYGTAKVQKSTHCIPQGTYMTVHQLILSIVGTVGLGVIVNHFWR